MIKRKRLGQHFLTSEKIAQKIIAAAQIKKDETVLEIGPGRGILTKHLAAISKKTIAIESDPYLFDELQNTLCAKNLVLRLGDGFHSLEPFDVFVSNLPYSQSRRAILWLSCRRFNRAVIMIQKEFFQKLGRTLKDKRLVSVVANHAFEIEELFSVDRHNFDPPPNVDSVVVRLVPKSPLDKTLLDSLNLLFSSKRKRLGGILGKHGLKYDADVRLEDLDVEEIIRIAKEISR